MGVLDYLPAISFGFLPAISFEWVLGSTVMCVQLLLVILALRFLYRHRSLFTVQPPKDGWQMWGLVAIPQSERWNICATTGELSTVIGPKVVWVCGSTLLRLRQFQATQAEYLRLDFIDGRSEILPGPSLVYMDQAIHKNVRAHPATLLNEHEVLVVYREEENDDAKTRVVKRSLVHGPCLHMPENSTEWAHEFSWHGSDPSTDMVARKVKCALKFKKLRTCPDQTYYDVENVRTKDDALLTIKLMIFFRLQEIDTMLRETHDPIADFVNAVSSDVIEFVSRKSFEEFKASTEQMNELSAYHQLTSRAAGIGFEVTKVVFRGYGAPHRLQKMHDDAIERRTMLALQRETEEQEQQLEDMRLHRNEERLRKRQQMEKETHAHERELQKAAHEAKQQELQAERQAQLEHLAHLKRELGVHGDCLAEYLIAVERGPPAQLIQFMGKGGNGNGTPPLIQLQGA